MILTLIRKQYRIDGIFGFIELGNLYFFTLEHSYDNKPKIPAGEYDCVLEFSPKFNQNLYELKDVPGVTEAKFHMGNYNHDSDGCILLGLALGHTSKGGIMLTSSKQALKSFHDMLKEHPCFKLVIEDTGQPVA